MRKLLAVKKALPEVLTRIPGFVADLSILPTGRYTLDVDTCLTAIKDIITRLHQPTQALAASLGGLGHTLQELNSLARHLTVFIAYWGILDRELCGLAFSTVAVRRKLYLLKNRISKLQLAITPLIGA